MTLSHCTKNNFLPQWTINYCKVFHSLTIKQVTFLVYPVHLANTLTSGSGQQLHAAFWLDWGLEVSLDYTAWCNSFSPLWSSTKLCIPASARMAWLCDSAVSFWVQEMWTRCQLGCVTEPCSGGLICDEGRQTDRQRNKQGAADMDDQVSSSACCHMLLGSRALWEMCMWECWHVCKDTVSCCDFSSLCLQNVQRREECWKIVIFISLISPDSCLNSFPLYISP